MLAFRFGWGALPPLTHPRRQLRCEFRCNLPPPAAHCTSGKLGNSDLAISATYPEIADFSGELETQILQIVYILQFGLN